MLDLTERKFGKWTVKGFSHKKKYMTYWDVECSCGAVSKVPTNNLRSGMSTGCAKCARRSHGYSATTEYRYWMRNKNKFVLRWRNSAKKFIEECYSHRGHYGMTLKAIDPQKKIGPGNFVWVDPGHIVEYAGVSKSLAAWARECGVSRAWISAQAKLCGKEEAVRKMVLRSRESGRIY